MKTLVTGASGFVGTHLVRRLVEKGEDVRIFVRESSDTSALAGLPVERRVGDIRDPWAVREAVHGCGRVYHAAALLDVGIRSYRKIREINVGGAIHVAAASRRESVERLVFTSSIAAIGHGTRERPASEDTPFNLGHLRLPYVDSKREAEEKILEFHRAGLPIVIVNPAYVFGAGDRKPNSGIYVCLAAKGLLRLSLKGGLNVVDVDDVVEGHIRAMEVGRPGERYVLGGENLSYDEFFRLLASVVHRAAPWMRLPGGVSAIMGGAGDLGSRLFEVDLPIGRATMRFSRLGHYVSSDKARRELGMEFGAARVALEKAFVWFREHGYIG
ncbi:MAG: NAD-dependent epimerase/dehydratase family protein [Planctomycetota bacterium]|nr:NAD-dependent epimerase/dehydratase family protein [Planctomycetota bacterium]